VRTLDSDWDDVKGILADFLLGGLNHYDLIGVDEEVRAKARAEVIDRPRGIWNR
jgi:hypothetical protein